jgi:hypothetical protein
MLTIVIGDIHGMAAKLQNLLGQIELWHQANARAERRQLRAAHRHCRSRWLMWHETTYASLSTVARAITGTAWSGPAFLGCGAAGSRRRR